MDLTKIKEKQIKQNIEPEIEEVNWEWPDAYYAVTDSMKRKKELEKAIKKGLEPTENEIRMKMWNQRYGVKQGVDQMLAAWINLLYFANVVKTDRKARWHKREIKEIFSALQFDLVKEYGDAAKELLYLEIYHMVDFYIEICKNDKKYNSMIMGLGTISKEKATEKMAKEIYAVCYEVPPMISSVPEYDLVRRAAVDCFSIKMPSYENVLLHMIDNEGVMPAEK